MLKLKVAKQFSNGNQSFLFKSFLCLHTISWDKFISLESLSSTVILLVASDFIKGFFGYARWPRKSFDVHTLNSSGLY